MDVYGLLLLCMGAMYYWSVLVMASVGGEHDDMHTSKSNVTTFTLPLYHRDDPSSPMDMMRKAMVGMEEGGGKRKEVVAARLRRDQVRVEVVRRRVEGAVGEGAARVARVEGGARARQGGRRGGDAGGGTAAAEPSVSAPVSTGLGDGSGEFFTSMGVGYRDFLLAMDTGSDLVWLQCLPCRSCYEQSDPLFDPASSPSFQPVGCPSQMCSQTDVMTCTGQLCQYEQTYGDGSFSIGSIARDDFYVNDAVARAGVTMGCGHDNEGLFAGAAGLLGLGRGALSFASQLSSRTGGIFSYCLSSGGPGFLTFGPTSHADEAVTAAAAAASTPLLRNPQHELTFYYVPLVGISIDGQMVTGFQPSDLSLQSSGQGGVIIDSGTTISRLVASVYYPMRDAFQVAARRRGYMLPPLAYSLFDTCYLAAPPPRQPTNAFPTIDLHFDGGAHISLPHDNVIYTVDDELPVSCLAFAPTSTDFSILGNIQQQGFLITFDTQASRLGFLSNQCSPPPPPPKQE